jgi:delta 1-pyrroline-5-carboxylate dehydrogenase
MRNDLADEWPPEKRTDQQVLPDLNLCISTTDPAPIHESDALTMTRDILQASLSFKPDDIPGDLWIDGQWCEGRGGSPIPVYDPSTGQCIKTVANASVEDALDAVTAARAALPGWAAVAPRRKSEILRR